MGTYRFTVGPVWADMQEGDTSVVRKLMAVPDPRAASDMSANRGMWDGRVHFFDSNLCRMPAGLLPRLQARLEKRGHTVVVDWREGEPPPTLEPVPRDYLEGVDLRDHQLEGANSAIAARRGLLWQATNAGKCLAGRTEVTMADGSVRRVDEVRVGDRVVCLGTDLRFAVSEVTASGSNGVRPVFDVAVGHGRTVRCTGNHPFLTSADTWTNAEDLRPGMLVAVPRRLPVFGDSQMPEHGARLLAYMLAEGTCSGRTYRFANTLPAIIEDFRASVLAFPDSTVRTHGGDHHVRPAVPFSRADHGAKRFLDAHGLRGTKSDTKVVPDEVFRLPEPVLAAFLRAFMSCDGHVSDRAVEVGLASRRMVYQLAHLLSRFGVWGRVRQRRTNRGTDAWVFTSRGADSVAAFIGRVGSLNPVHHRNAARIMTGVGLNRRDPVPVTCAEAAKVYSPATCRRAGLSRLRGDDSLLCRTLAARLAGAFGDPTLAAYGSSDLAWVPVESVTPSGAEETFDLTVARGHNFVADDVVVHNTEQIAAIVGRLVEAGLTPVLVIVPNKNILHELSTRLRKRRSELSVGRVGDGHKEIDHDVVVGIFNSLAAALPATVTGRGGATKVTRKHNPGMARLVRRARAVLVDEAHHAAAAVYQDLLVMAERAWFRIGFSGTVDKKSKSKTTDDRSVERGDAARVHRWRTEQHLGPVLHRVTNDYLIGLGYSAVPKVFIVTDRSAFGPDVPVPKARVSADGQVHKVHNIYGVVFERAATKDQRWLRALVRVIRSLIDAGKPPFVFSHSVDHLRAIKALADERGVPCEVLYGNDSTEKRDRVVGQYARQQDFAVLTSSIFDEGANVPEIRAVVLAGARRAVVELLQRVGRGIRAKKDENRLVVVDFRPAHCRMLLSHAEEREAVFRSEGFAVTEVKDVTTVSGMAW